jgi:dynein regulatory complex protein 1
LKLLAPLHKDEQNLMKLDSIFKALGVETLDDVTKLSYYFIIKSENTQNAEEKLIHPNDAIKAIRRFFESQKNGSELQKHCDDDEEGISTTLKETRVKKAGKSKEELQKEYWKRMANIIDEKSSRVWNAVYAAMEKYNTLLNERWSLTQEISAVQTQNEELKNLLKHYMSAKINEELQVPPTQIMLAQAGLAAVTVGSQKN